MGLGTEGQGVARTHAPDRGESDTLKTVTVPTCTVCRAAAANPANTPTVSLRSAWKPKSRAITSPRGGTHPPFPAPRPYLDSSLC